MTGIPYQQGNPITLDATFLVGTTPTDPTTVTFKVRAPDGTITTYMYGPDMQVTRIAEGSYECALGAPADAGEYHYQAVGTGTCEATLPGDFYVIPSSVTPPVAAPGPVLGPNVTWINGEDITNCAGFDPSTDPQELDAAAVEASMTLYELSGRQFTGLSQPVTARPASGGCDHWGDFAYGGYTWVWLNAQAGWGWWAEDTSNLYGCGWLSRVTLNSYPVRQITAVKIDGNVLPTTYDDGSPTYRLDQWRHLTRLNDPAQPQLAKAWPACQNLALPDTEPGTFSVTYRYGVDPPPLAIAAARQLACQLLLAGSGKPCQLPSGVTKITKQGVTLERGLLGQWGRDPKSGAWMTGLALVDAFLNTYNPRGLRRRPAVLKQDIGGYAPILGEQGS